MAPTTAPIATPMASPDQDCTPRTITGLSPVDSALAFALAIAMFLSIAIVLGGGLLGLAAGELIGLVGLPLAIARVRQVPMASIGLTRAPWRALAGGALIGATIWYVNVRIASLFLSADPDAGRELEAIVRATPVAAIVILSTVPPLAEELSCRGVLALGLRRGLGPIAAVAISTCAFALLHPSWVQLPPMVVLGAVLGTLTVRSGSVFPAVIAHAINNAIALLIANGQLSPVSDAVSAHPDVALAAAVLTCAAGVALAWMRERTDPGGT